MCTEGESIMTIVQGSINALAMENRVSIAETFINADIICLVDTSASMDEKDSRGGNSRYEVACEELALLQKNLPGKIAVISFSSGVMFCPNGVPSKLSCSTNLEKALKFVKVADVPGMRFILISDGEPDDENSPLAIARTFKNKIDVVYVGPEENPYGRDFLQRLASVTGGKTISIDRAKELQTGILGLLKAN
jgi:hypothetical protein